MIGGTAIQQQNSNQNKQITNKYDTRCYFNVRSKANMSQLNLPHARHVPAENSFCSPGC